MNELQTQEAPAEPGFVPTLHDIKGIGEYLGADERKRWFRKDNPKGKIEVEILLIDIERGYASVKATVTADSGAVAENYGSAQRDILTGAAERRRAPDAAAVGWDFLEFATTSAISRALAGLGYGTSDAQEKLADSPRPSNGHAPQRPQQAPAAQTSAERVPGGATVKQVNAIFAIGRNKWKWDREAAIASVQQSFGKVPDELNGKEASEVIEWLNSGTPQ